jgi:hypothetical protein
MFFNLILEIPKCEELMEKAVLVDTKAVMV